MFKARETGRTAYRGVAMAAVVAGAFVVAFVIWADVHDSSGSGSGSGPMAVAAATQSAAPRPAITLSAPVAVPQASSPAAGTAPPPAMAPAAAPAQPKEVSYTVKAGDNLTVIAAWFNQHGYQPVYAWNRTVIGADPNLIFPGQVIVVAVEPATS